jgi:Fe2+ transport system protein FeoA
VIDRTYASELLTLDRLPMGRSAWIDHFVGCSEHVRRLQEMGLRQGMLVTVVRHGRPCIVRAGANRLCFRCSDLLGVLVRSHQTAS